MDSRPVAVITGSSRGIGRAVALALAPTHRVVLHGRDRGALEEFAATLPDAAVWVADLTADLTAEAVADLAALDRIDLLVQSAGIADGSTLAETPRDAWRRVFEVNVFAAAEVTRVALPALRRASGLVVYINSGSGFTANPGGGVYAASKFALRALADAVREEERASGVRVTSLHPGRVDTDMQRELVASEGDAYDPALYLAADDIAVTVRYLADLDPGAVAESIALRPLRKK